MPICYIYEKVRKALKLVQKTAKIGTQRVTGLARLARSSRLRRHRNAQFNRLLH